MKITSRHSYRLPPPGLMGSMVTHAPSAESSEIASPGDFPLQGG